ncbi:FecR family protein [Pseudomonas sp. ABC1]|uniref:FecR family protein n=1 Tax=Pseudomonas sp. ABC1 TaxID=2748080 RepID=UPI0015C2DA63|nr:FecR family protein [Pseudomonas sp. ABC1]QLF93552.1 FecR family protein [Pseudomonas sp. ABC1]
MPEENLPSPETPMEQALDWMIRLESGEAFDHDAFRRWLDESAEHTQAFALAERAWGSQLVGAAAELTRQRLPAISTHPVRQKRRWRHWAVAASLALAVCAGLLGDLPTRLQADWVTGRGEQQQLQLEDGSRVLLGSGSAFATAFDDASRKTRLLKGEAYFEVAGGQPRPFLIDAGEAQVRVVGTAFGVRHLDGKARVSVRSGIVEVSDELGHSRRLGAGEQVDIDTGGLGVTHKVDTDLALAWTRGRLVFEESPLGDVVAELRRHYPGLILMADAQLAGELISGNYRLDQPENTLHSLAELTQARLSRFPGGFWMHR